MRLELKNSTKDKQSIAQFELPLILDTFICLALEYWVPDLLCDMNYAKNGWFIFIYYLILLLLQGGLCLLQRSLQLVRLNLEEENYI